MFSEREWIVIFFLYVRYIERDINLTNKLNEDGGKLYNYSSKILSDVLLIFSQTFKNIIHFGNRALLALITIDGGIFSVTYATRLNYHYYYYIFPDVKHYRIISPKIYADTCADSGRRSSATGICVKRRVSVHDCFVSLSKTLTRE